MKKPNPTKSFTKYRAKLDKRSALSETAENYLTEKDKSLVKYPLNIILYGAAGTGKTYQAVNYAVAIIENLPITAIQNEARETVINRYNEYRQNGQIEFITFHQNYAYEDFIQGLKPDVNATGTLRFKLKDGIFKCIADKAKKNYDSYKNQPVKQRSTFEDLLHLMLAKNINPETEEIEFSLEEAHRIYKSIIVYEVTDEVLIYKRCTKRDIINKEEKRELQIQKIKDLYEGRDIKESINQKYYEAVVEALLIFEEEITTEDNINELKNYVIIIDEINRANISRVFGELITLIEEDKRYGNTNGMTLTLPSGENFTVPPNLYLIGTMNTADKSIALLDIALRRRFEFIAMFPDEEMLKKLNPVLGELLKNLNQEILKEKKTEDLLIGHAFFMGKTEEQLEEIFNQKIIPLLNEYFSGRKDTIQRILNNAGVKVKVENYQLKYNGLG